MSEWKRKMENDFVIAALATLAFLMVTGLFVAAVGMGISGGGWWFAIGLTGYWIGVVCGIAWAREKQ